MSSDDVHAGGQQDGGSWGQPEMSARVNAYLEAKGVRERSRASMVAEITGLSVPWARQRLKPDGQPWLVGELGKLCHYFGDELADFFAGGVAASNDEAHSCEIEIGGRWYASKARIGGVTSERAPGTLVGVQEAQRWMIVPAEAVRADQPCHEVSDVQLHTKPSFNVVVGILDDDLALAEGLRDDLRAADYSSEAFAAEDQLLEEVARFDVFILDFLLAPGRTASSLVGKIRVAKPHAPIIVLTGHARDSGNNELATLIRNQGVDVMEKPAEVAILVSMMERRLPTRAAARFNRA